MKKQLRFALLALTIFMTAFPLWADSNTCGNGVLWTLSDDGVLTIEPADGNSGTLPYTSYYSKVPWYSSREDVTSVVVKKGVATDGKASFLFFGMTNCTSIDVSGLDVSNTSTFSYMFTNCKALETITGIEGWDMANAIDLSYMFKNCAALENLDLNKWNTSNVKQLPWIFSGCKKLTSLKVNTWDISNVESLEYVFADCSSLQELNVCDWNTASVTTCVSTFANCSSLTELDLSEWNTENVTEIYGMLNGCTSLKELYLNNWNVSNVTASTNALSSCTALELIETPETAGSTSIELPHKMYDWSNNNAEYTTLPGDELTLHSTTEELINSGSDEDNDVLWKLDATGLLSIYPKNGSSGTLQNITKAEEVPWYSVREKVTMVMVKPNVVTSENACYLFAGMTKCKRIILQCLDVSAATDLQYMFSDCSALVEINGLNQLDVSNVTNMSYMFKNCTSLKKLTLPSWSTSKVESMEGIFKGCSALADLSINKWDVSSVTTLEDAFNGCSALKGLGISSWTTTNVKYLARAFQNCSALTSLDLSDWNTSNATDLDAMFAGCTLLQKLDMEECNLSNVTSADGVFTGCDSLKQITTPDEVNTNVPIALPFTMYDQSDDNEPYTTLPGGSLTIYREPGFTAKPTFTPSSCVFLQTQQVALTAASGATIYYTTDGSDPTTGALYTGDITLSATTTIKAIAYLSGVSSDIDSATYTLLAAPTFSPAAGTYRSAQTVKLTAIDGATIYYTTDGSDPTTASTQYTEGISIDDATTIKAIAVYGTMTSPTGSAAYAFSSDKLEISPDDDETIYDYGETLSITIDGPAGTTIYYTLDGSTPSAASQKYEQAFNLTASTQVKAIAVDASGNVVDRDSIIYKIRPAAPSIVFSSKSGTGLVKYGSDVVITAADLTDGFIQYTITDTTSGDTQTKTIEGDVATAAMNFGTGGVSAIAIDRFGVQSAVANCTYTTIGTITIANENTIRVNGSGNNQTYTIHIGDQEIAVTPGLLDIFSRPLSAAILAYLQSHPAVVAAATVAGVISVAIIVKTLISNVGDDGGGSGGGGSRTEDCDSTVIDIPAMEAWIVPPVNYVEGSIGEGRARVEVINAFCNDPKEDLTIELIHVNPLGDASIDTSDSDPQTLEYYNTGTADHEEKSTFTHVKATVTDKTGRTVETDNSGLYVFSASLQNIETHNIGEGEIVFVNSDDPLQGVRAFPDRNLLVAKTVNEREPADEFVDQQQNMTDYVRDLTDLQQDEWDNSMWVMLDFSGIVESYDIEDYVDRKFNHVVGNYENSVQSDLNDYHIKLLDLPVILGETDSYQPNNYIVANFMSEYTAACGYEATDPSGKKDTLRFEPPMIGEYIHLNWAQWDATNKCFVIPEKNVSKQTNGYGLEGNVTIGSWNYNDVSEEQAGLSGGSFYDFDAIVLAGTDESVSSAPARAPKRAASSSGLTVAPVSLTSSSGKVTDVIELVNTATPINVTYYDITGTASHKPFNGINIVVTTYNDGTTRATKLGVRH